MLKKTTPIEVIKDFIVNNHKLVSDRPDIAKSQYGTERESSKDYSGRIIYEFFQNAVDRADKNILIELTENELIIQNDGNPFSIYDNKDNKNKKSDFHSLNTIHNSSKVSGESIGNKGVGFKSCWNISDHVVIESKHENNGWGFELFNPVRKENFIDFESNKLSEVYRCVHKLLEDQELNIPSFYFPKYKEINDEAFMNSNFVTKITIKLKENHIDEIKNNLTDFKSNELFFLQFLKNKENIDISLKIKIQDEPEYQKNISKINDDWVIVKADLINKEIPNIDNYDKIPEKPNVAIAFPLKEEKLSSSFYTYLPTEINCGFNVLIHADFVLDNARKSIPNNQYNEFLLDEAANLLVTQLENNEKLHKHPSFAYFLLPHDKKDHFAQKVWNLLITEEEGTSRLTRILRKVYTEDASFPKESYEKLISTIDEWTPKIEKYANKNCHYNYVYEKYIHYFCDEEIFIVTTLNDNKTYLQKKEDKESRKLFYIQEDEDKKNTTIKFPTLKNISFTSCSYIGNELFKKLRIVLENSTLEILRALALESKNIESSTITVEEKDKIYSSILTYIFSHEIVKNESGVNTSFFNLNDNDPKYQFSRLYLPIKTNHQEELIWKPANECCNMEDDIFKLIDGFYNVDIEKVKNITLKNDVEVKILLNALGAWSCIPIKKISNKNFLVALKDNDSFHIKKDIMQTLLDSVSVWSLIQIPNLDEFKENLQQKNVFRLKNDKLVSADELFLFHKNDHTIKEKLVNGINEDEKYKAVYEYFEIKSIENTDNQQKLINQLESLSKKELSSDHNSLYKKLTLSLSKIEKLDGSDIKNIPMLTNKGYQSDNKNIWFTDQIHKRYKRLFEKLDFVLFDEEISKSFVKKIGIKEFKPIYTIEPHIKEETTPQNELKSYIQSKYLHDIFCLAEEQYQRFNFDDAINRWKNLKIFTAQDVYLKIELDSYIETVGKEEKVDVLLYDHERDNKNAAPEIYHDLSENIEEIINNDNFRKFGEAISDAIFRNKLLGDNISLYLQSKSKYNFLIERGITKEASDGMKRLIIQHTLSEEELSDMVNNLKSITGCDINKNNWNILNSYSESRVSYNELIDDNRFTEKQKSSLETLNPEIHNRPINSENFKKELKLRLFKKEGKIYSDDEIDNKLKNKEEDIKKETSSFSFNKNDIFNILELADCICDEDCEDEFNDFIDNPELADIYNIEESSYGIKTQSINIKSKTTVRSLTHEERSKQEATKQKRGKTAEQRCVKEEAVKIFNFSQEKQEKFINAYGEYIESIRNDDQISGLNTKLDEIKSIISNIKYPITKKVISELVHVSKTLGDGLGYDVLEFDHEKGILNRIEVKSSADGSNRIYLSQNEVKKIMNFIKQEEVTWKLYYYHDKKRIDQTDNIIKALKEDVLLNAYMGGSQSYYLIPDVWIMEFES